MTQRVTFQGGVETQGERPVEFTADVRWLSLALTRQGYTASDHDIERAYEEWSEDIYAAGWMQLMPGEVEKRARQLIEGGYLAPPRPHTDAGDAG